jgi:hypothetical protein
VRDKKKAVTSEEDPRRFPSQILAIIKEDQQKPHLMEDAGVNRLLYQDMIKAYLKLQI